MARKLGPAQPRGVAWNGAGAWLINSQSRQENFSRTCWITFHWLATADPGKGIRVSEWSEADIEETFRLRIILESHATELAALRGGDELVERLAKCNQVMATAIARSDDESITIIQETNREFHRTLIDFAGSPRLRAILDPMIDMPIVVRSFFLCSPEELAQSLHHHEDITIAARLRDGELGRRAMQLHLRMSYARVLRHRERWRRMPG